MKPNIDQSHISVKNDRKLKKNSSQTPKNYPSKSFCELEKECIAHMESRSFLVSSLVVDGCWKRLSVGGGNNKNEWYIAKNGISSKGNLWLFCTYGTFSGGHRTLGIFKSWEEDRSFSIEEISKLDEELRELEAIREEKKTQGNKDRTKKAVSVWEKASITAKSDDHMDYLDRKKVKAYGIRFTEKDFNEGTNQHPNFKKYSTILIPLRDTNNDLQAIQHIRGDGAKRFNGPTSGGFHVIGSIGHDSHIFVCEGYATAATVFEATGCPVVVAFNCGNIAPVLKILRKKYSMNQITIAGDDDVEKKDNDGITCNPGRKAAEYAAHKYTCQAVFPNFKGFRGVSKCPNDWNDLANHCGIEEVTEQLSTMLHQIPQTIQEPSPEELKKFLYENEYGDVSLFKTLFGRDYLYDPYEKVYYVWEKHSWRIDNDKTRYKKLKVTAKKYIGEAERLSDLPNLLTDEEKKYRKKLTKDFENRAKSLMTLRRTRDVLKIATSELTFKGKWNDCVGYLPCANGLVNLKTGALSESKRSHYIRKNSSLKYDASAKCPLFEKFVLEIIGDSKVLYEFLQRLFGYISIGNPIEHIYVFLYGALGRNGKGVLVRIISKALGHLSRSFQSELLLKQRNSPSSGSARPDLINLEGTRLALFSEINENRTLDSALLKKLSGGDNIVARPLFGIEREFDQTHTIVFQANEKPKAPSNDSALWSRSVLIPFDITFVHDPKRENPNERKIDTHLESKLQKELQGVVRWIVEGACEYYRNGLQVPQEVRNSVEEYRSENDGIGSFIKDCCELVPELSTQCSKIRDAIKQYCSDEGLKVPTKNKITQYLLGKGFKKHSSEAFDSWMGISLKNQVDF